VPEALDVSRNEADYLFLFGVRIITIVLMVLQGCQGVVNGGLFVIFVVVLF
jgi:hypothetical protein